jgi:hypothetical protein
LLALLLGCRGTPPGGSQDAEIVRLVDSLRPAVERATGLRFRGPTRSAMKSRDEMRDYLVARLREDFPPRRAEGITAVYRLLGFIPDSLDLKTLLLDLYTEQVAGFYDPGSKTLYGVRGSDPAQLRLVLAHELVHALQDQYLPLDSIMRVKGDADQQAAAQAVLEGHATLASIKVLLPGQDVVGNPQFWQIFREQIKAQQTAMKVFGRAPLALREELIFPYLNGAEFMRWWDSTRAGRPLPTVATLPRSTEQILHPARYAASDEPLPVRFADSNADVLYEDTLGELEVQVLATVLRGGGELLTESPVGWGGDRFRIYRSAGGPALVWYSVWDDAASARRFLGGVGARLLTRERAGYRTAVEPLLNPARPTVRVVIAPTRWGSWSRLPAIR